MVSCALALMHWHRKSMYLLHSAMPSPKMSAQNAKQSLWLPVALNIMACTLICTTLQKSTRNLVGLMRETHLALLQPLVLCRIIIPAIPMFYVTTTRSMLRSYDLNEKIKILYGISPVKYMLCHLPYFKSSTLDREPSSVCISMQHTRTRWRRIPRRIQAVVLSLNFTWA